MIGGSYGRDVSKAAVAVQDWHAVRPYFTRSSVHCKKEQPSPPGRAVIFSCRVKTASFELRAV